jgi:WD40 repeat protein
VRELAWLDDGRLVFSRHGAEGGFDIRAFPAGGGPPTVVETFEKPPSAVVAWDLTAIPGGRFVAVLLEVDEGEDRQVLVGVDASGTRRLLELDGLYSTCWVPGGSLLLQTRRSSEVQTWIVRLSTETLEIQGEPELLEEVLGGASVSSDGTLAYVASNATSMSQLAWWSPDGTLEPLGPEHQVIASASYSPLHETIVYDTGGPSNPRDGALFRLDLRRGVKNELSTGDLWCAGGMTLADGRIAVPTYEFDSGEYEARSILLPASGRGALELWQQGFVRDVTDDMRLALVVDLDPGQIGLRAYVADLETGERTRILNDHAGIRAADISPDGKWLVFDPGGSTPALLTRFPSGEGEWPVSADGVRSVAFSPEGERIYYATDEGLYAVELRTEPEVELGVPELVGHAGVGVGLTAQRAADSERFLAIPKESPVESNLVVVQDWVSRLEER